MEINISSLRDFFLGLQDRITTRIASVDGKPFIEDAWVKAEDSPLQGDGRCLPRSQGQRSMARRNVRASHLRLLLAGGGQHAPLRQDERAVLHGGKLV